MATFGPTTGLTVKDPTTGLVQDIGNTYVSKSYIIDNYANLLGKISPGAWVIGGQNTYGQLGTGNTTYYSSPVQIGSLTNWKQIDSGQYHSLAVKTDGTLWGFGYGINGELGTGAANLSTTNASPVQIGTLTTWKQVVATTASHAIKTDGTLWAWGDNSIYGVLGNGSTAKYSSPIQIGSLTNWLQISAGNGHTMAVKTDGTLWGWGFGTDFRNGVGSTVSSPIQIGSLTTWKKVACTKGNGSVSIALKTDGTLWGCGNSQYGELLTVGTMSLTQLGNKSDWADFSVGFAHVAAVKTDGTLWAWGYDAYGQIGNNTVTNYSSPVQIGSMTNWKKVSCGRMHTVAIKTDGTLWSWGDRQYGQLGRVSSGTDNRSPVQIGTLSNWKSIGQGTFNTFALQDGYA
jgi:alpha-tubulin suppressor-like RCC1 family protein